MARASSSVSNLHKRETTHISGQQSASGHNLLPPPPPQWNDDVTTDLMTGTSGPKVSSFMHSMSVVTSASRVGSTKELPTRFPPRSTFAPRDTASDIWCATCRTQRLSEGKFVKAA